MNRLSLVKAANTEACQQPQPPASFMCGPTVDFETACVQQLFEAQVQRTPDAIAVELEGNALTYRELNQRANALAHHLRSRGVGPDVLVGVSLERSLDLIVAVYAILKAGGAYVPLDPTYPSERLHYMATAVPLKCLLTHSSCAALYAGLSGIELVLLDENRSIMDDAGLGDPEPWATGANIIYVIFTSGSTGQPKAAAVYHHGFSNLVEWFVREFEISKRDHALLISSLSFDLTQKNLFATLISGGSLHLQPPGAYDLAVLTKLIREHGITLINCTPSAFYPLVEPFDEKVALPLASLRVVFLGGEPISIARIRPWITHATCTAEVANTYGPTECTDICGFYRLTLDNLTQYEFVPLGRPIANVQMAILNSAMELSAIGEAGELCVGGAGVGAGYVNDVKLTSEKFVSNQLAEVTSNLIYRTGDQARWHPDGVIEFLGRLDHQVKIRGFRIELPEIESAVETHPAVNEAIVIIKEDRHGSDPQLACCFTLQHGMAAAPADLRCHLNEILPGHMMPAMFEEFSAFPLSPNGKVDRRALSELVRERQADLASASLKSATGLESQIESAWCQVLDRAQAGMDDNFFDLGGDSLRLARLHQILKSLCNRDFPITDLFAYPTIRGQMQHLSSQSNTGQQQQSIRDRARMQREAQAARRRTRS